MKFIWLYGIINKFLEFWTMLFKDKLNFIKTLSKFILNFLYHGQNRGLAMMHNINFKSMVQCLFKII